MRESLKTKKELIEENTSLKQRIQELEKSISKIELLEETDKERELNYRSLIEHSSDVVFCVDRRGEYKFVNQVFASTFGKTPDYFLGKTFWDIYPKEHADHRQAANIKVFETGESQSVEVVVPLQDRTLYYLAKANPVRDETGEVVFNVTHAIDISDRRKAEEALKESERKYRLLADNIKEVFWMAEPNVEKMIYISPAYEKVWGRSCESLYESPLSFIDAIHPEDRDDVANTLALARAKKISWNSTYRIIRPDGSVRWIEDRGFPVFDDNGMHYLNTGIAKDITAHTEMEEALRESEEKYRTLVENVNEAILIAQDGKFAYANSCKYIGEQPLLLR